MIRLPKPSPFLRNFRRWCTKSKKKHNTAPLNGLLSLKRAYSSDLLLWFAGHVIKCYQCLSEKSWDACVPGNNTTCASPLNSCLKFKIEGELEGKNVKVFLQRMRLEKELQPARLQSCRTVAEDESENLQCRLLRHRPVQWSQSTNGQQLPVLSMRPSS